MAETTTTFSPKYVVETVLRPLASFLFVLVGYSKLVKAITRSILLPSSVIGKNKQHLDLCVKTAKVPFYKRVMVDNRIDAVILVPPSTGEKQTTTKGWLVYSNANGVCYEHILRYTSFLGKFFNRKVCVFNYRGVGFSTGTCENSQDMIEDLAAVIRYLHENESTEKDEEKEDFLLWGHSIGGAVSLLTAHYVERQAEEGVYPKSIKIVADRSFSNLELVVRDKISQGPLAPIISGLLVSTMTIAFTVASLLGFNGVHPWPTTNGRSEEEAFRMDAGRCLLSGLSIGWVAIRMGTTQRIQLPVLAGMVGQYLFGNLWLKSVYGLDSLPCIMFTSFALAFELGFRGKFNKFLETLVVNVQGWKMDVRKFAAGIRDKNRAKGDSPVKQLVVTFHVEDEMIPMDASLKTLLNGDDDYVLELDGPITQPHSNHMYELNLNELEAIKKMLKEDSKKSD